MDSLQTILGPEALGWAAALLTLLTFISGDMRRLRLLALAANAAFIAYGTAAQLLPVMVLHLALVPVNLWRLNQAFQRKTSTQPDKAALAQRAARQPSGWTPAPRGARVSRRQVGSVQPSQAAQADVPASSMGMGMGKGAQAGMGAGGSAICSPQVRAAAQMGFD